MSNPNRAANYKLLQRLGGWANIVYYGTPAAALLLGMFFLNVGTEWWTPVLVIYATLALGNIVGYGFQASNMQMAEISDYWEKKLDAKESR